MKTKAWLRLKFAARMGVALLADGAATVELSAGGPGADLATGEILKKAQETYASLTSYADEGKTVSTSNGTTNTSAFTIKLARPDLYRIVWVQPVHSNYTNKGAVWSAGDGDFLEMGRGANMQASQEMALAGATGISGGAAATIPGTFFKLNWGNQLAGSMLNASKQPDEKVGDADCYVLTSELEGRTRTLWIGKQDFLIHQARTVTSAEAMKATLVEAAKRHPEIIAGLQNSEPKGNTATETHENIIVNTRFSPADFAR